MKIVRLAGDSVVHLVEAPDPVPGPGEVVVQTAVSALCGSEMHAYRGEGQAAGNAGHEAVGTVVALGEGVTGLSVGERVGASAIAGCGACAYCAQGQYTWCPDRRFYGSNLVPSHPPGAPPAWGAGAPLFSRRIDQIESLGRTSMNSWRRGPGAPTHRVPSCRPAKRFLPPEGRYK